MERVFSNCPQCNDLLEMEYRRGSWHCENCGKNLTEQVVRQLKREAEFERKYNKRNRR